MANAASPLQVFEGLARLPARNRFGLALGLAALAAVLVASWLWSRAPDWRVLYANLSDRDGGAIVAQLSQMNVPYRIADGGGAILVPATVVHDARLRLAVQGLPKGSIVGFELLENQKLGATQFQEQVNYQRGLEGELARTIQSLAAVAGARVHLAIPKPSVFVRERQKPSASVMLALHPGRTLERAQIQGILNLVAASVPDLSVKSIAVVDQSGTLLSSPADAGGGAALDAQQLAWVREIEAGYVRRILDIVEPVVGRNNVRAQVTAEVDFTQSESTAESYKPNQDARDAAVRSQTTSESSDLGARPASGVPGAQANQPGAAPLAGAAAPAAGKRDASIQYEVDRTVRVVRQASGALKRLSAAVVVNHRRTAAGGKASYAPLKEEELAQLGALVREAIGYSKARGDSLNLVNAVFSAEEPAPLAETPAWKKPETIAVALEIARHLLIAGLLVFLAGGVLRPVLRSLATPPPAPPASAAERRELAGPGRADQITAAKALARQDPKIVANVVKSWVGKE